MAQNLGTSETVACNSCGSTRFVQTVHLMFSPTLGAHEVPAGLRCVECQGDVDKGRIVERHKLKKAKDALAAQEAEQKELEDLDAKLQGSKDKEPAHAVKSGVAR